MSAAYHGGLRQTRLDASPDQVIDENETGREVERILGWEMNEEAPLRETWYAEEGKMDLRWFKAAGGERSRLSESVWWGYITRRCNAVSIWSMDQRLWCGPSFTSFSSCNFQLGWAFNFRWIMGIFVGFGLNGLVFKKSVIMSTRFDFSIFFCCISHSQHVFLRVVSFKHETGTARIAWCEVTFVIGLNTWVNLTLMSKNNLKFYHKTNW